MSDTINEAEKLLKEYHEIISKLNGDGREVLEQYKVEDYVIRQVAIVYLTLLKLQKIMRSLELMGRYMDKAVKK